MQSAKPTAILVIGVGNEYRGDDGVGAYVARAINDLKLPGVTTRRESGEGASLIDAWRGYDNVVLVDATSSGKSPGHIHRLEAGHDPIPSEFFHYSTHAFSLAEAVELARVLGQLPPTLVVFGIEGKSFAAGRGLTEEVRRAADDVILRIEVESATGRIPLCTKCP